MNTYIRMYVTWRSESLWWTKSTALARWCHPWGWGVEWRATSSPTCTHICMYKDMYKYMFVHTTTCLWMCTYVCVCVCGLVYMYTMHKHVYVVMFTYVWIAQSYAYYARYMCVYEIEMCTHRNIHTTLLCTCEGATYKTTQFPLHEEKKFKTYICVHMYVYINTQACHEDVYLGIYVYTYIHAWHVDQQQVVINVCVYVPSVCGCMLTNGHLVIFMEKDDYSICVCVCARARKCFLYVCAFCEVVLTKGLSSWWRKSAKCPRETRSAGPCMYAR